MPGYRVRDLDDAATYLRFRSDAAHFDIAKAKVKEAIYAVGILVEACRNADRVG